MSVNINQRCAIGTKRKFSKKEDHEAVQGKLFTEEYVLLTSDKYFRGTGMILVSKLLGLLHTHCGDLVLKIKTILFRTENNYISKEDNYKHFE